MSGSYQSQVLGERFHLERAPTLLARTASVTPIGFTRLKSDLGAIEPAAKVTVEQAFSFHVALLPTATDLWIDGKHHAAPSISPGATFLFDLSSDPISHIYQPFDVLRFYISQASLDEMAYSEGDRRATSLVSPRLGARDHTMHGLATALLDRIELARERSTLFVDHIALAFYAHVTETYGHVTGPGKIVPGQLSPWQLRRAVDFIAANLDGDPTIAQLAVQCGLSSGYFAGAFRRTTGVTPHQWLIRKRVERAQELLLRGRIELAEVAVVCGFVDQSHFSRVFAKFAGMSPGRWRQRNRGSHL
ncbi:AraC family transcriptional regulator [Bradyrhizobium japonicum]|uniref:AraC family transcriptional regulator n=1 Tax=Bradyrhizobium japonicum TaxID=375 RepID=UPI0027152F7D|nr:AraC family transcriptional regulator [Bradyrhizobium japonicum]WLB24187.1 AraC family transcriptional regulator [Bradyrhizobium japonicum]